MALVEQLVGAVPPWMELGPPVMVNGVECHEILGDHSDRAECDRLPKYVSHGWAAPPPPPEYDRSPDRPPLTQKLPGKDISLLKGIHRGAVALLFNGPTLAEHDLGQIKVPLIGMNRTHSGNPAYKGREPDYLCVIDKFWFRVPEVVNHPRLINGSIHAGDIGYRATRSLRAAPFSFDLAYDGYVCPAPCTTGHLALQIAVWMGFTRLYCLGFDLGGGHFDGTRGSPHFSWAISYHRRQATVLKDHGIDVFVCGSPASRAPFPRVPFEALLAEAAC